MNIPGVAPSEWEDFEGELRRRNRDRDEFCVSACTNSASTPGVEAKSGMISVRHRNSGNKRTYMTGWNSTWVGQFARDLDAHVF